MTVADEVPQPVRRWAPTAWQVRLAMVFLLVLGVLLAKVAWTTYQQTGLFRALGFDWAMYLAQSQVLRNEPASSIYDVRMIDAYLQPLAAYTAHPDRPLAAGPVAYPPLFAWLMTPLTWMPPPLAFGVWTAINVAGALWLAWRIQQRVAQRYRACAVLLLLTAVPVFQTLFIGHPMTLLACAVGEAFLALRGGHEFRAGLWIACLFIKPQYGLLIGPYLVWKRRWGAVAGALLGGAIVLAGSIIVAGVPALLAFPEAVRGMASFRDVGGNTQPEAMINWRALVLAVWPRISEARGVALTMALGVATVVAAAAALRGPWQPRSERYAAGVTLLLLGTLLANYHSHGYGAVLLAVPLAYTLADTRLSLPSRLALLSMLLGLAAWTAFQILWPQTPTATWPMLAWLLLGGFLATLSMFGRTIMPVWVRAADTSTRGAEPRGSVAVGAATLSTASVADQHNGHAHEQAG